MGVALEVMMMTAVTLEVGLHVRAADLEGIIEKYVPVYWTVLCL